MMSKPARFSFLLISVMLVLVAWLSMATPLITILFAYVVLDKLHVTKKKWLTVSLFAVLVSAALYLFGHFIREAWVALPEIAEESLPRIAAYTKEQGLHLPFEDLDTLKTVGAEAIKDHFGLVGNFAKTASKHVVYIVIGLMIGACLFLNPQIDLERERRILKSNLYTICCDEIGARFRNFYRSFATVMGAQVIISAINTILTAIFVLSVHLPYSSVVIGITFLCGLLPIIGNILSNAVIVGIGFTISPNMAMAALVFLIVLHKLQYVLNSKIIGDRIKNPVWLTLLGLVIGERMMGIAGLILAPVILNYVKMEAAQIEWNEGKSAASPATKDGPSARATHV